MKRVLLILFLCCCVNTMIVLSQKKVTVIKNCKVDTDDDGINDCFDQCANTPKGTRVDSKGCPRDTDGDGVPDYKDKQIITLTECQPCDTNGVGNCNRIK